MLSIEFEYFAMISLKALNRAATLSDSRLKFNNSERWVKLNNVKKPIMRNTHVRRQTEDFILMLDGKVLRQKLSRL